MKSEDTIVKTTEMNCHNTLEERLSEQAQISFKAGIEFALSQEGVRASLDSIIQKERLEGRKEVVEWIRAMNISLDIDDHVAVEGDSWNSQLRKWGI